MPARQSEAFVLRTYPYREADLVVSFLARDRGKLRGIANGVRRPKSRFGSGLERLSHVRAFYYQKETQELVKLDGCELLAPPVFLRADYPALVALDFLTEVTEHILPEHEPNEKFFRLLLSVVDEIRLSLQSGFSGPAQAAANGTPSGGGPASSEKLADGSAVAGKTSRAVIAPGEAVPVWLWRALAYFSLWSLRLGGWLAPLNVCVQSGVELGPDETVFFERSQPGLISEEFRSRDSWAMSPASRAVATEMLRKPLKDLREQPWAAGTAVELRRFLTQRLEAQVDGRLKTAAILAQL
jgi:DNA repair protein RecO (recombination protein O)